MTEIFHYQEGQLHAEEVPLADISATIGTPTYVYSRQAIESRWSAFNDAFGDQPHLVCYAVKANSNLAVLNVLARLGSGFDIVSVGELERVLKAGGVPSKIVFSGVGKQRHELQRALEVGIGCFNVESRFELEQLQQVAACLDIIAPISIRINPDVDAKTHPYISTGLRENKFGLEMEQVVDAYQFAVESSHLEAVGIDCHIGSQLTETAPFLDALDRVLELVDHLASLGISLKHIDLGGGLGVCYQQETPPSPAEWISLLCQRLKGYQTTLIIEPGRAIIANAGVLVTEVIGLKSTSVKNFAVVDCAMNDLIRPSLYQAWQDIVPLQQQSDQNAQLYDIVGPICETGDFLGKDRQLAIQAGDLLAIKSAGAYGFTMSSNYNSRPRAAEVMVDGYRFQQIRARETLDQLWENEQLLADQDR